MWFDSTPYSTIFMKNRGYSLIEVTLSIALVTMFLTVFIVNMTTTSTFAKVQLDTKIENYVSLNKYVKYNSQLTGKISKVLIISNKLEAVIEDDDGEYNNIFSLQSQVDDINEDTTFGNVDMDIITYFPDGYMETEGILSIIIDETNNVFIDIDEWSGEVSIIYTNKVEDDIVEEFNNF